MLEVIMIERRWVYNPKPAKLTQPVKDKLRTNVRDLVNSHPCLKSEVSRIDIRAGRIYLFHLVEQYIPDNRSINNAELLIDGKYLELPMARITLYDTEGSHCTADWLRHTGQWYELHKGSLKDCLAFIEGNSQWF
jgi:hypothetical protein